MMDRSSVENKAEKPPVFGPGLFHCPKCGLKTSLFGRFPNPLDCPDCKVAMTQAERR